MSGTSGTMRVSVVIPARNAEAFVTEAIRSAVAQSVAPAEIVVVDDGSTDGTARVASTADDTVRVISQPHAGIGPARSAGIASTVGDLVAFLDADDLWLPQKLERQLAALDADPALEAVFCRMDEFVDTRHPPSAATRAPRYDAPCTLPSGALLRRGLVDRLGPIPATPVGEWLAWWGRTRRRGP